LKLQVLQLAKRHYKVILINDMIIQYRFV
jgi:hypothetical protein